MRRPPDYYAEMARLGALLSAPPRSALAAEGRPGAHACRRFRDPAEPPSFRSALTSLGAQVKNDEHMRKVREKLIVTQKAVEAKAERKQQREQKKYSKEVQAQKQKERKAQQKADAAMLHKMKKKGAGAAGAEGAHACAAGGARPFFLCVFASAPGLWRDDARVLGGLSTQAAGPGSLSLGSTTTAAGRTGSETRSGRTRAAAGGAPRAAAAAGAAGARRGRSGSTRTASSGSGGASRCVFSRKGGQEPRCPAFRMRPHSHGA